MCSAFFNSLLEWAFAFCSMRDACIRAKAGAFLERCQFAKTLRGRALLVRLVQLILRHGVHF